MKDDFTLALSDLIQHQVELAWTVDSLLGGESVAEMFPSESEEVRRTLCQLNSQVNDLAKKFAQQYGETDEQPIPPSHAGNSLA